jgi:hypothetical protein
MIADVGPPAVGVQRGEVLGEPVDVPAADHLDFDWDFAHE